MVSLMLAVAALARGPVEAKDDAPDAPTIVAVIKRRNIPIR